MTDEAKKLGGPRKALLGTVFVFGIALGFAMCFGMGIQFGWNFGETSPRPPASVSVKVSPSLEPKANTAQSTIAPVSPGPERMAEVRPTTESLPVAAESVLPPVEGSPVSEGELPMTVEGVIPTPPPPEPEPELWPGRFLMVSVRGTVLGKEQAALLKEVRPGGVILTQTNIANTEQLGKLIASIKAAVELGTGRFDFPLIGLEQEGGAFNPLGLTPAPSAAEMAKRGDVVKIHATGQRFAEAAAVRGVALFLAPVLNVSDPDAGDKTMEKRTFGPVPEKVAEYGLAFADGVLEGNVIPVVTGFPALGHAATAGALSSISADIPGMAKLMYAFAEASVQGVPGIMAGHVMAPTLDAPGVKRSAAFSPVLIGKVLRDLWKYEGVVIADDVAVERVAKSCPAGVIPAVEALKAGCDTVLFLNPDHAKLRALCADIDRAMKDGTLDHARLVKSARRLDRWPDMLKKNTEQQSVEPESGVAAPAQ